MAALLSAFPPSASYSPPTPPFPLVTPSPFHPVAPALCPGAGVFRSLGLELTLALGLTLDWDPAPPRNPRHGRPDVRPACRPPRPPRWRRYSPPSRSASHSPPSPPFPLVTLSPQGQAGRGSHALRHGWAAVTFTSRYAPCENPPNPKSGWTYSVRGNTWPSIIVTPRP